MHVITMDINLHSSHTFHMEWFQIGSIQGTVAS